MELRLTDTFGAPEVSFENGYTGTYTYEKNVLKLQATSASPKLGAIATVKFHVPSAAARGSLLTYTLEKGSFTDGGTTLSFAQPAQNARATASVSSSKPEGAFASESLPRSAASSLSLTFMRVLSSDLP